MKYKISCVQFPPFDIFIWATWLQGSKSFLACILGKDDLQDIVLLVCVLGEREWCLMIVPVPMSNDIVLVKFFPYLCIVVCVAMYSHPLACVSKLGLGGKLKKLCENYLSKLHSALCILVDFSKLAQFYRRQSSFLLSSMARLGEVVVWSCF